MRHMLNLTRLATTPAPIIARGVGAAAPFSVVAVARWRWNLAGLLDPSPFGALLQRRFASSTTGAPDVRDVRICIATKSLLYIPSLETAPGMNASDVLAYTGDRMAVTINDGSTTDFWVPRRVAGGRPTALEERNGVYWPAEMPLHELIREHGITPNPNGEVFVLAGPLCIGDRAYC
jgi:hypothetical protein